MASQDLFEGCEDDVNGKDEGEPPLPISVPESRGSGGRENKNDSEDRDTDADGKEKGQPVLPIRVSGGSDVQEEKSDNKKRGCVVLRSAKRKRGTPALSYRKGQEGQRKLKSSSVDVESTSSKEQEDVEHSIDPDPKNCPGFVMESETMSKGRRATSSSPMDIEFEPHTQELSTSPHKTSFLVEPEMHGQRMERLSSPSPVECELDLMHAATATPENLTPVHQFDELRNAGSTLSPQGLRTNILIPPVPSSPKMVQRKRARDKRLRKRETAHQPVQKRRSKKPIYTKRKYEWLKQLRKFQPTSVSESTSGIIDLPHMIKCASKQTLSRASVNILECSPAVMYSTGTSCFASDILKSKLLCATADSLPFQSCASVIRDYLKLILSDSWSVTLSGNTLCICWMVNRGVTPVVERSIVWEDNRALMFVRNRPLPIENIIWGFPLPDVHNFLSICDYIAKLCNLLPSFIICKGIASFKDLWIGNNTKGYIEQNFCSEECFRTFKCSMLVVSGDVCKNCRSQESEFLKSQNRITARAMKEKDASKMNLRYMQKDDLVKRIKELGTDKILLTQKLKRLQNKFDKLIKKHSVPVDSELSEDFIRLINENHAKMSEVQKVFWKQQQLALNKTLASKSKSIRWHPLMIRMALHLKMISPAAYEFLREHGFVSLPSQRRLYDYAQFLEPKEGCQHELMEQLKQRIENECKSPADEYFVIMMDEMTIRSNLVYSRSSGQLVGFTNLSDVEKEVKELESEINAGSKIQKKLAKKVLVYLASGITSGIVFVPAIYSTDDLTAYQLFSRTWEVIHYMEDYGARVLCVICDGASVNRKFIKMHPNFGSKEFVYVTKNVACGDRTRPLYFILDPPHLWKTFRNCLANSYAHRKSRILYKNDQHLSWQVFVLLLDTAKGKYRDLKLTKAHVKLTSFSCMKVILAVQIFSNSVVKAIKKFKDSELLKAVNTEELCKFLTLMNRFVDCLNGGLGSKKMEHNADLRPYESCSDARFDFLLGEFLSYFEDWDTDVERRPGRYSKDQRKRMKISYQTIEAMKITVHSFVDMTRFLLENGATSISSRVFNQDLLEQLFSVLRMKGGANNNPNLQEVLQYRLSIHAQGSVALPGNRGNTEVKRVLDVEEASLPVRKKVRRSLDALNLD